MSEKRVRRASLVLPVILTLVLLWPQPAPSPEPAQGRLQMARQAMNLLKVVLRQAGNDPTGIGFAPISLQGDDEIIIRSDVSGNISGKASQGDPDGRLEDAFERVRLRYQAESQRLSIDVGSGETLQIPDLAGFRLTFYDRKGQITRQESQIVRARIQIWVETARAGTRELPTVELASDVWLRNRGSRWSVTEPNRDLELTQLSGI